MNRSIDYLLAIIFLVFIPSCAKEVVEPEQMISGNYALDDDSQVSDTYLCFEKGYVIEMVSSSLNSFAENHFWNCKESDFEEKSISKYSIQNGELFAFGRNMGHISQEGDVMILDGKKYTSLEGFKNEYYSKIVLDKQSLDYLAKTVTAEVTIENPIRAGVLTASTKTSWISNVKVTDNKTLSYTISGTNVDRQGTITLSYTNAQSYDVTISQEPATHIVLPAASGDVSYSKKTAIFEYSIDNPVATSSLSVSCSAGWVSKIQVKGNTVEFEVEENVSNSDREATFTMKYAGAADVTYVLIQKGMPVTFLSLNKTNIALTAGEYEHLVASVTPSDAEIKWISNHPEYAKVDASGKVTALDAGTATITVSAGDKTASCTVIVSDRENGLSISTSWTESTGLTYGKSGTILISNPTGGALSISSQPSSSVATATLSANKVTITPVSSGETNITIKSSKTTGYAGATKTVSIKVLKATPVMTLSATNLFLGLTGKTATISVTTDSDGALSASSSNTAVATVTVNGKIVTVRSGTVKGNATITILCSETSKYKEIFEEFSCQVFSDPDLVDLGLSVKWASCNLGASKPTEYGGYCQWAGTTDVSDTGIYLDWSNCPYHSGSSSSSGWTKYNTKSSYGTVDNKTVLESLDDVASVALGGKWRMPTDEEWSELMNTENCSWTWTTIDGVNGYKVQSKKPGYTDNWIFLPAAGYRNSDHFSFVGSYGRYRSSSLYTDYPYDAYGMYFNSGSVYRNHNSRFYGHSVRPVSE